MAKDFSNQNLRGQSFKDRNLQDANFSHADIRSANFTNANLINANFSHVKAGLQPCLAVLLISISFLCSALSGFALELGVRALLADLGSKPIVVSVTFLFLLVTFCIATILRGLTEAALVTVTIAIIVTVVGAGIGVVGTGLEANVIIGAIIGVLTIALVGLGVVAVSIAGTVAMTVAGITAIAGVVISTLVGTSVAVVTGNIDQATVVVVAITGTATILGAYATIRALAGEQKFAFIKSIAIGFASIGGTNYRGADLTDANFTKATLKNIDLRKANINRTCWFQATKLDLARVGTTYLEKLQVQQLLVTGQGIDKNFDGLSLRGVNLRGANLQDASFIGADLSEANLQDADLSRAILKQTQLNGTDFTGATITGAYIEDWGITSNTNFDGVRCEYVYMRLPTKENPDPWRKPDNREEVFADGEFGDFIKPIVDTLDLYHNQGVDPRAIAIAYKQLAENNPDAELEIVAMEKRSRDKFLLRAKTAPEVDKSQLSVEYFENYNYLKGLPPSEQIKHFLTDLKVKDNQINFQQNHIYRLENMISTALERPSLQAQNIYSQGGIMSQSSKKESNFNLQGAQFGGALVNADTVNAEQIGGNITNYGQQQQQKEAQTETNNSAVKTILILSSNPKNTSQLRLDEEVREIDAGLQRAKKRELFDLKQRWSVRVQDVYQALLDLKPQIVHFSGHGSGDDGLALEDEAGNLKLVDTEALAKLFELFSTTIECVILNACYSEVQAQAIAKHIPYVIGMNKAIGDKAAVKFATGFYNALGTGESVEFAYKLGCNVIQLDGIPEHLTPVLRVR
jgi:uncharacterized protein YjbI with pentapeptide repeats